MIGDSVKPMPIFSDAWAVARDCGLPGADALDPEQALVDLRRERDRLQREASR